MGNKTYDLKALLNESSFDRFKPDKDIFKSSNIAGSVNDDLKNSLAFDSSNTLVNPTRGLDDNISKMFNINSLPDGSSVVTIPTDSLKNMPDEYITKLQEIGFKPTADGSSYMLVKDPNWLQQNKDLLSKVGVGMNLLGGAMNLYGGIQQIRAVDKYVDILKEQLKEAKNEYQYKTKAREHLKNVFN